jgi:HAD superfamily hydrolase (TIGR01484 family)
MHLRLVVFDIDGVLTCGEGQPWDLSIFRRLAEINTKAKSDNSLPSFSVCSGRPAQYVEAITQAMSGWRPSIYEHGTGIFFPDRYHFEWAAAIDAEMKRKIAVLRARVEEVLVDSGKAFWQPDKSVCLSLYPHAPNSIYELKPIVEGLIKETQIDFSVSPAAQCLNIHPRTLDKGSGLRWLAETLGLKKEEIGSVGDSSGDIPMLKAAGFSAAPANASADVKACVHYVSPHEDAQGVHDILDTILA